MADKPILVLNFDGVIHSYTSGWHGVGVVNDPLTPGAIEWLHEASKLFRLAIFSSRSNCYEGKQAMRTYLTEAMAYYYRDNGHSPNGDRAWVDAREWLGENIDFPDKKPAAFLTIDDRAIQFNGHWPDPKQLLDFKPWNNRPTHGGMQRFKRKHSEIEAYQWDGSSSGPGLKFMRLPVMSPVDLNGAAHGEPQHNIETELVFVCETRSGVGIPVQKGQWIVAEPDGTGYYPVEAHIFAERYEPI